MTFSVFVTNTLLSLFIVGARGFVLNSHELTGKKLEEYVNSAQSLFIAEHQELTETEMQFKIMDERFVEPRGDEQVLVRAEILPEPLPDTFDARDNWPDCKSIKSIRNQATCGSCWAFGAAEIISDRICIQSNGTQQPVISVEDILTCCGETCGDGCAGGYSIEALRWWKSKGAVTGGDYNGSGCRPYSFAPCSKSHCETSTTPSCSKTCQANFATSYANDKHFGASAYAIEKTVAAIQTEIYHSGPVEASFRVYEDFYQYKSGVYKHTAGQKLGGHAVKIIGWGSEEGTPYWLIANSWGTSWGEKGFFRMYRGGNDCGIESNVVAGVAKLGDHPEKVDDDDGSASGCSLLVCILAVLTSYLI